MAEARRRARERFGVVLEREVELLGDLELPPRGVAARTAANRGRAANPSVPARARRRGRLAPRVAASAALRVVVSLVLAGGASARYVLARQTPLFAVDRIEVAGAPPAGRRRGARDARAVPGDEPRRASTPAALARRLAGVSEVAGARFDRAFPHTLKVSVRAERPVAVLRAGRGRVARLCQRTRPAASSRRPYPRLPRIWVPRSVDIAANATLGGLGAQGVAARRAAPPLHIGADVAPGARRATAS